MKIKKLFAGIAVLALLSACQAAPMQESTTSSGMDASAESPMSSGMDTPESMAAAAYHKITAEEASGMMAEQEVIVVDVRTAEEYAEGHVPGAILLPNESIGEEAPDELPDMDATLLVYCRSGRRSREASEKLLALGYQNVYDFGGIIDWPYDIVKE